MLEVRLIHVLLVYCVCVCDALCVLEVRLIHVLLVYCVCVCDAWCVLEVRLIHVLLVYCVCVCVCEVNIIILLLPSTSSGLLKTLAFEREGVRERS